MAKECAARVVKRRKGYGWTKRRLPKSWPAKAILEEDRTRYLIEWEPVGSGAECERKWEPKRYANATLVADWEERQRASPQGKSDFEQEDTSILELQRGHGHRYGGIESDGCLQKTAETPLSPVEHGADSGNPQKNPAGEDDLTDTQPSGDPGNSVASNPPGIIRCQAGGLELVSGPRTIKEAGLEEACPRPGTSISTSLSPAPFTVVNKSNGSAVSLGGDINRASLGIFPHASVSDKDDLGVSGGPPSRLAIEREKLRSMLRGSGERRIPKFRPLFPPSP
jgi:hypothetical protein